MKIATKRTEKNPDRVSEQLPNRALQEGDAITNFVPEATVSLDEDLEALTPAVEVSTEAQPIAEVDSTPDAVKDAPAPSEEATKAVKAKRPKKAKDFNPVTTEIFRAMLGKATRAYKKAGEPEATEETKREFIQSLLAAGIPVMKKSSGRLSRVLKREIKIDDPQK